MVSQQAVTSSSGELRFQDDRALQVVGGYAAHGLSAFDTCHGRASVFVEPHLQVPRGRQMLMVQADLLPTIGPLSWALGVGYGHLLQEVPSHWQ